jgi:hypothetical protein
MSEYRFMVDENTGTIYRAKAYRLPEDWTTDAWSNYFDGDFVGFYVEYGRSPSTRVLHDDEDNHRAVSARTHAAIEGADVSVALKKVAQRITGQWDADFIHVGLDRGTDFYVMTWGPSPDWAREIEAVNEGDIWRIEIEELLLNCGCEQHWVPADEYPEEFYGEDKATAAFASLFPLTEFPADLLVTAGD